MASKKGTRLFKIASQINVGKDTIVEFLQSKGVQVENRATFVLTDEMVDQVLEQFQREHDAARKQRARIEEQKQLRAAEKDESEQTGEETAVASESDGETISAEQTPEETSQPEATSETQAVEESDTVSATADSVPEDAPVETAEQAAEPETTESAEETVPVGTVIDLDSASKKKSKKKKTAEKASPEPQAAEPVETAEPEVAAEEISAKQEEPQPEEITDQPEEIEAQTPETPKDTTETVTSDEEPPVAEPDVVDAAAEEEDIEDAEGDEEYDEDAPLGPDGKRKRRKTIVGELEYQSGEVQKLPGLTILGKIELSAGAKKKDPDAPKAKRKRIERTVKSGGTTGEDAGRAGGRQADKGKTAKPGFTPAAPGAKDRQEPLKGKGRKKKGKKVKVSEEDVERAIKQTLSGSDGSNVALRSKIRQKRRLERAEEQQRRAESELDEIPTLQVTEFITVSELANLIETSVNDVILKCMQLGLMVSINQRLDKDTITLIADDYGFEIEFEEEFSTEAVEDDEDDEATLQPRAPIVTIMGHVDHGKTSLLDYIRSANVVAGESGGITQHIGAYAVNLPSGKTITFLDTPGHEAFTAMRARGAQITDIVILVVSADDSVMPQTIEAISHAKAANVPIVVAINKMDKPEANPDRIKQQLSDHDILVEDWGGKIQSVELSAKSGQNVEQLLEKILLEAELLDLKANPDRKPRGAVIESRIDKGKGSVGTIIVQKGTLKVGDPFICGVIAGRVRAMLDERGKRVEQAGPSTPVQVLGYDGQPQAGDTFVVTQSESAARDLALKRLQIKREHHFKQVRHITLDDIADQIKTGGVQDLPIVLKADADGSVEALTDSLQKLSNEEVRVSVIHKGVGAISESDIMLASASNAIVIGFHVRPTPHSKKLAEIESVDVRIYRIIYDCINEVKLALEGMLNPEEREETSGTVEVREIFKISRIGTIAGCYVLDGKITRNDTIRIVRDGFEIKTNGRIQSLKRMKDDVREVDSGYECGIGVDGFNDIKVGDIIEAVKIVKIKRKLAES